MTRTGLRVGCLALLLCSTPADAQRSGRRVWRSADIAAAGWHRLGDVVAALPPGSTASVDGFNYQITSLRLPFAGPGRTPVASWIARLDGQHIPVSIDGMWIFDALPVAMTQIDSVVVNSGARIVDGHAVVLGTIDLYTRQPRRGVSALGDYQHGDESGDPGPYRYTARSNPNVEKLGPFASGAVAYGGSGWSLDGAARYSSLNITDTNISSRFPSTFGQLQSDVNASGGSGTLTTMVGGGMQKTIAGRGRFTGLLWVPSLQSEQSVRVISTHAGSTGTVSVGGLAIRYGATGTELDVNELRSPIPFVVGHTRTMADAFVEVTSPRLPVAFGAGVTTWRLERGGSVETEPAERAWLEYTRAGGRMAIAAEHEGRRTHLSGTAAYEARAGDSVAIGVSVAALRTRADADGAWIDQLGASAAPARAVTLLDARGDLTTERFRLLVPTVYGRLWTFSRTGSSPSQPGDGTSVGAAAGFQMTTAIARRVSAFVGGEVGRTRSGVGAEQTPASFVEARVSTVAAGNFLIAASGRYSATTSWPSLASSAPTDLPSIKRVDLSMNKPFWHERVRAQLALRNALQQQELYHPVGAQWNLRTHLAVTVALPPYRSVRGDTP